MVQLRKRNKFCCYVCHVPFLGYVQGAFAGAPAAVLGLTTIATTVAASEKPITLPSPPSVDVAASPALLPSGPNIIPNVYFPIEKLNKNLISTNDSPHGGGSSSSRDGASSYNNNNNRRQSQQSLKFAGQNDLRPDSDLINTGSRTAQSSPGEVERGYHQQQPGSTGITGGGGGSIMSKRTSGGPATVSAQLNNHAYLNCKVINPHTSSQSPT